MITLTNTTLLRLYGIGVPPFSIRGATQTLVPIAQAKALRRTVNGALLDLSVAQFHKYNSVITNSNKPDVQPPAFDGVFPGAVLTMSCIAELCQEHSGYSTETSGVLSTDPALHRPAVSGSIRFESGFVFYRPVLQMMVMDLTQKTDEYGSITDWTLTTEEV